MPSVALLYFNELFFYDATWIWALVPSYWGATIRFLYILVRVYGSIQVLEWLTRPVKQGTTKRTEAVVKLVDQRCWFLSNTGSNLSKINPHALTYAPAKYITDKRQCIQHARWQSWNRLRRYIVVTRLPTCTGRLNGGNGFLANRMVYEWTVVYIFYLIYWVTCEGKVNWWTAWLGHPLVLRELKQKTVCRVCELL